MVYQSTATHLGFPYMPHSLLFCGTSRNDGLPRGIRASHLLSGYLLNAAVYCKVSSSLKEFKSYSCDQDNKLSLGKLLPYISATL